MTAASALASLDHIATASTSQAHAQSTRTLEDLQLWAQHAHASHLQWTSAHAIGPLRFIVQSNDPKTAQWLTRCLLSAPDSPTEPDFTLSVFCADAAPHQAPPPWNLPHTDARHLERLQLSPDGQLSAYFDLDHRFWFMLNKVTRQAMLWTSSLKDLPFWEEAAPFRQIIQWQMNQTAMTLLHGGVVTNTQHGVLLTGPGGSGKSTTVAACLQAGLKVCGDDLVAVEHTPQGWLSHSAYDAVKLIPNSAIAPPPVLASAPWSDCGDKRLVRYSDTQPNGQVRSTPLQALVHCVITGKTTSHLTPIPPAALLMALGPSTAFMLRGRESHILSQISRLARSLPCYRLSLGRDPAEAAALIRDWLDHFDHA
jgi:hypothetical protein